jgi:F-type H+-transporting ATPase subunit b
MRVNLKQPWIRNGLVPLLAVMVLIAGAGMAWASSEGEAAHGGFTSTDAFRIMNFVVLAGVLFFLLRKPIPRALNNRIRGIQEHLKDLEAKKSEAEAQLAAYNQKLSALEKEAERIVADYIRQGQEAKARILKEAESASEKIQLQARRNIEHEFEQTKSQLQREIFEKALLKAEELLKQNITAQDQNKLIEEYLQKVVAS